MLHANQMRRAVHAISANIGEAFGRGTNGDRVRVLRIARGEAEETIRHLDANLRSKRISPNVYWSIRNLLVVIVKMLNALVHR